MALFNQNLQNGPNVERLYILKLQLLNCINLLTTLNIYIYIYIIELKTPVVAAIWRIIYTTYLKTFNRGQHLHSKNTSFQAGIELQMHQSQKKAVCLVQATSS